MSRLDLITLVIVVVCLAALGYLVYKIAGLYKTEEPTTPLTEAYGNDDTPDEQTYTDWDDEVAASDSDVDLDDDELGSYADTDDATEANGSSSYSDSELDPGTTVAEESSASRKNSTGGRAGNATAKRADNEGKYMVIAGQFRQRSNADSYANTLRGMGYSNTQVKLFDRGTYAVVLVDRFDAYSTAKRLVDELTQKGVTAMVSK